MAVKKLSEIIAAPSAPVSTDTLVGVSGGNTDYQFSLSQVADSLGIVSGNLGVVNVKDFGADGRDRLYKNIVGGSGYTGGSAGNLITAPEDYTDGSWITGELTVIANAVLDPRGAMLADAITESNTAGAYHTIAGSNASVPLGSTMRAYVEIKPGAREWVSIYLGPSDESDYIHSVFHLSGNGSLGLSYARDISNGATKRTITPLANGFYLCMIEGVFNATNATIRIVSLLGPLGTFAGLDMQENYTGSNAPPAFYLGRSQLCAVTKYKGSVYNAADSIYPGIAMTGGSGTNAMSTITVGMGQVLDVDSHCPGYNYIVGDTLSCGAADIGGTGSGFTCQVQTLGDDTLAVQAAIDSGNGNPVTVYFPSGTYNVFPRNIRMSDCLYVNYNGIKLLGAGRDTTKISCFVSGGRHPETSWDISSANFGSVVWRGNGMHLPPNLTSFEVRSLRLTGNCVRHNNTWPIGGGDPYVISASNPLGINGDGDGWDLSHHAVTRLAGPPFTGLKFFDCEVDSWKGEIIAGNGDFINRITDITNWSTWVESCYIHDTLGDGISIAGNNMCINSEIAWCTNGQECGGSAQSHNVVKGCHIHDCTHGITPVVGVDGGASSTGLQQQIITDNLFERCYRNGVFVYQFQCNVSIDDNIFVDCGVADSVSGGAIAITLLSGSQPYANIYVRRNTIYNHLQKMTVGIGVGMSLFSGSALKGVYIENNRIALTPAAQAAGRTFTSGIGLDIAAGCEVEVRGNDFRIATSHIKDAFSGGKVLLYNNNIQNEEPYQFSEVNLLKSNFDKTNNTLADVTPFKETYGDSAGVWFEATLFVTAPAGGAKIAVVSSGSIFRTRYDVEMWAGTTIDAASGQGTASGTVFASAAAITKIRISGYVELNYGSTGDLKIQFAQNSTNVTASSVLPGSWFKVRETYQSGNF